MISSPGLDEKAAASLDAYVEHLHLWKIWALALACALRQEKKIGPSLPRVLFWLPQLMLFRCRWQRSVIAAV